MKDAYYFPHDSNAKSDPKILMMISELGMEGYGIYWALIETLREQPDYKYPLKMLPILGQMFFTTAPKVKAVVEGYGLFEIENEMFFYSESLNRRMLVFEEKRQKRISAGKKGGLTKAYNSTTYSIAKAKLEQFFSNALASKVKESKLNEIKLNEIEVNEVEKLIGKNQFCLFSEIDLVESDLIYFLFLVEWMQYKNNIKHPYKTALGLKKIFNKIKKYKTAEIRYVMDCSIENNYQGLFWDKVKSMPKPDTPTQPLDRTKINYEQSSHEGYKAFCKRLGQEEKFRKCTPTEQEFIRLWDYSNQLKNNPNRKGDLIWLVIKKLYNENELKNIKDGLVDILFKELGTQDYSKFLKRA